MQALRVLRRSLAEIWFGLKGAVGSPEYGIRDLDYDEYWKARGTSDVQPRYQIIARYVEDGARVLDVGCGDRGMLEYVTDRKPAVEELGIDISTTAVQRARNRGVEARRVSLEEIVSRGDSFDYVIMSEVLEHLPEPEAYVRQAWSVARRGLLLTFPSIGYWPHRLRLLLGRFPVQWVIHPGEHLRFWSLRDFEEWLPSLAIEGSEDIRQISWVPSNGFTLLSLHKPLPNLFGNQIVVVVNRTEADSG